MDRVVWRGKVIKAAHVPMGDLVYRNDEPFLEQRNKIIRLQWFAIIVAIAAIVFFLASIGPLAFLMIVIVWLVLLLMDVVQLNMWKRVDRGVVVHENGLDTLDYRAFSIGRVFVPRDEISHVGMGLIRFNIYLRHSDRKLFCHWRMVDDETIWHIWRLLEGRIPEAKGPELFVYSEDGASRSLPQYRI
jgi:hypothetical protein